jgi:hypothetical protein
MSFDDKQTFALLLTILQPFPVEKNISLSKQALQQVRSLAQRHNLLMLVYSQLSKSPNIADNESVQHFLEELRPLYIKNAVLSASQESVENEVVYLLQQQRIPSFVLRGNRLAKQLYRDPNCRTSSDIDILIKQQDACLAQSILTKAGYRGDDLMPLEYCLNHIHHASFYHQDTELLIEIHWNFGVPTYFHLTSEAVWQGVGFNEFGAYQLTPESMFIMLLIHHHSHAFRELKILVDILWCLYRYEAATNWAFVGEKLKAIGLLKTAQITINQLVALWHDSIQYIPSIDGIWKSVARLGQKPSTILMNYFKINESTLQEEHYYQDRLLARFALDSWRSFFMSFIKTVFPDLKAVQALYRDSGVWRLPLHYARFIRWRLSDWFQLW